MATAPDQRSHVSLKFEWVALALVILVVLVAAGQFPLAARYDNPGGFVRPHAANTLTVDTVASNTPQYLGQTLALTAQVADVVSPQAIQIVDQGQGGTQRLLVLFPQQQPPTDQIGVGEIVQINGTLRTFLISYMNDSLGYKLDPQTFSKYEGNPVLIAQSVTKQPSQK